MLLCKEKREKREKSLERVMPFLAKVGLKIMDDDDDGFIPVLPAQWIVCVGLHTSSTEYIL